MRNEHGITFLEVVFSSAMLAVVAATITSGFALIDRLSVIGERKLAAHEVAHRLVLQFLDNPTEMPPDTLPLPGEVTGRVEKFWYLLNYSKIVNDKSEGSRVTTSGQANAQQLSVEERFQNQLSMVTVEVYEDENGRRAATPIATINRVYGLPDADTDPKSFIDHIMRDFEGQPEVQAMLQSLMAQMIQEQQMKQQQIAPPPLRAPADTSPK